MFLSSFLNAPRLPLFPSFAQFSEWLVFPPPKFSNRIRTQIPDKKTWNLTDLVSPFEFLSQTCFGWFLFFSCETLVGTSSLIAWWEAILEMLDSVVVCCFPLSVLRDWGLCLQTCLLFQPVFHTDLLKWPLPYSEQITPPGKQRAVCVTIWQNLRSLTLLWSQLVCDSFFHAYLFCFLLFLSQLSV